MTQIFIFTLLSGAFERFHLFEAPEKNVKIKKLLSSPPPPPPPSPDSIWATSGKTAFCRNLDLCAISVSLTIEIHKNNIDTFRVTNKQYYKTILF